MRHWYCDTNEGEGFGHVISIFSVVHTILRNVTNIVKYEYTYWQLICNLIRGGPGWFLTLYLVQNQNSYAPRCSFTILSTLLIKMTKLTNVLSYGEAKTNSREKLIENSIHLLHLTLSLSYFSYYFPKIHITKFHSSIHHIPNKYLNDQICFAFLILYTFWMDESWYIHCSFLSRPFSLTNSPYSHVLLWEASNGSFIMNMLVRMLGRHFVKFKVMRFVSNMTTRHVGKEHPLMFKCGFLFPTTRFGVSSLVRNYIIVIIFNVLLISSATIHE